MSDAAADRPAPDLRTLLRERPMSSRQWIAVWICVLINIVDGYEILAAGFTAPAISKEFGISVDLVGMFLSASPLGMIVGALWLSPLADLWGRRIVVLGCLLLAAAGMWFMLIADGFYPLVAARLVTGVGVGAMMVAVNTVVAECGSDRQRDLALVLQATGFPLGGAICGFLASAVPTEDWRTVYLAGAIGAACLLPMVVAWLPESLDFLLTRRAYNALAKLQAIASAYRLPVPTFLPEARRDPGGRRVAWRELVSRPSLMVCASYFLLMLSFYFLVSWAPKLLAATGTAQLALSGAALISAGGVAGDLAFAALVTRWRAGVVGPVFALLCFASATLLASASHGREVVAYAAFGLGFFLYGSMASHYAVVPLVYSARVRASGTGLAVGIGRVGAACGPILGAYVLSQTNSVAIPTIAMTLPVIICGGLLYLLSANRSQWLA